MCRSNFCALSFSTYFQILAYWLLNLDSEGGQFIKLCFSGGIITTLSEYHRVSSWSCFCAHPNAAAQQLEIWWWIILIMVFASYWRKYGNREKRQQPEKFFHHTCTQSFAWEGVAVPSSTAIFKHILCSSFYRKIRKLGIFLCYHHWESLKINGPLIVSIFATNVYHMPRDNFAKIELW